MTREEIEKAFKKLDHYYIGDEGEEYDWDDFEEQIIDFALAMCKRQREEDAKIADSHLISVEIDSEVAKRLYDKGENLQTDRDYMELCRAITDALTAVRKP